MTNPVPRKRYITDDNKPAIDLTKTQTGKNLHAEFTRWVATGMHVRDFPSAVEHSASCMFLSFLMEGQPVFSEGLLAEPETELSQYKDPQTSPQFRLYDETDSLSPQAKLDGLDKVLAAPFCNWVSEGWLARDFVQAVKDCAAVIVYDYQTAQSLGGLGGGKTGKEFLTLPYKA